MNRNLPTLDLATFQYDLPEENIAKHPLKERDQSKLLIYNKGNIEHDIFKSITHYLPKNSLLFFNNTKVISARLFFYKSTGAKIEIFLLQPEAPTKDINQAMLQTGNCTWQCMIGNLKKWKTGQILETTFQLNGQDFRLKAQIEDREKQWIHFTWEGHNIRFVDVIEHFGQVPLPPYINRLVEEEDKSRYQTVYSKSSGAVAAPTAGLHFNETLLNELTEKGLKKDYLTLHVSAGTFQPIKENSIHNHPMHSEQVLVTKENVKNIIEHGEKIISVGTTSMRTLESLYWYGAKILLKQDAHFHIDKLEPYQYQSEQLPTRQEAVKAVLNHMEHAGLETLNGTTEIMIFPGYQFKVCDGLITNYHLPGSTLILLVAAFVGDQWRKIYEEALDQNYRFLSYGDSSLLLP
ncbi:S-adenosylmethionine:tRNA ribosyltransferase-isomerase [Fulvivirgaceae bacterium BMA10]|uniref:S-adenosylmethionine:tRNA ribosyltransferase-isomerase n=1 Tax=Splendidivirga corallicola TaxID=3051826 RepID=A0ABT8KR61_9BACT|nr:S-adenosylmethionine:tRNA ribosyltransferase-isomerase [Fulvivirgaceae bacterium BMA10]